MGPLVPPGASQHEDSWWTPWHRAAWTRTPSSCMRHGESFCTEKPKTLFKVRLYSQNCLKKINVPFCLCVTANPFSSFFILFHSHWLCTASSVPEGAEFHPGSHLKQHCLSMSIAKSSLQTVTAESESRRAVIRTECF